MGGGGGGFGWGVNRGRLVSVSQGQRLFGTSNIQPYTDRGRWRQS